MKRRIALNAAGGEDFLADATEHGCASDRKHYGVLRELAWDENELVERFDRGDGAGGTDCSVVIWAWPTKPPEQGRAWAQCYATGACQGVA